MAEQGVCSRIGLGECNWHGVGPKALKGSGG